MTRAHTMPASRRRVVLAGAAVVVLGGTLLLGVAIGRRAAPGPPPAPQPTAAGPTAPGGGPSPGAGAGRLSEWALHVEPTGFAAEQVRTWRAEGHTAQAAAVRTIADQPAATWFGDDSPSAPARAARLAAAAAGAGRLPLLAVYFIPGRDCAGHSAGGAADGHAYREWITRLAKAIAGHPAVVVLEPDAVAHAVDGCLDPARATERYQLLAYAIDAFRADPGVRVYLDAGHPTWVTDPARMAEALRRAGVDRADGFALNVSNFETTESNVAYGTRISDLLGGAHFVIDTSRNGNGPAGSGEGDRHWCNPRGRSLGETPTTKTGHPRVDAYLWVKRPGESDGACGHGAPAAGQWWPAYALELTGGPPTPNEHE